jgi:hypothetical protein
MEQTFIKTDNGVLINKEAIRWMQNINECLEVCIKTTGCMPHLDTHRICKAKSPESYAKLHKHFEK